MAKTKTKTDEKNMQDVTVDDLHKILAHSRVVLPDLESPYSSPNTTIEPNDQSLVRDIITKQQQQLHAVSQVISDLERLQKQLIRFRKKTVQSISSHKNLASTLWRLPNEILSLIFVNCLFKNPTPTSAPTSLTRVCRRWREIAIDMPNLWCKMSISVAGERVWDKLAFCYNSWLKRSRGHPLSLQLMCRGQDAVLLLLRLLRPYKAQISSMHIIFLDAKQPEYFFLEQFPALWELTAYTNQPSQYNAVAQAISRLPILRSLNLPRWPLNDSRLSSFTPVWGYLTNVEININQPIAFLRLLELGLNLSSVRLQIYYPPDGIYQPLKHSKLQSLYIHVHRGNVPPGLLKALTLPNLRVLQVSCSIISLWPHAEFKAFLARSKYPLKCLVFSDRATITDDQRAEYVARIPSLSNTLPRQN